MRAKENRPVKKVHLTNFHIAGFSYWDGQEAFDQLKVGIRLDLVRGGSRFLYKSARVPRTVQ